LLAPLGKLLKHASLCCFQVHPHHRPTLFDRCSRPRFRHSAVTLRSLQSRTPATLRSLSTQQLVPLLFPSKVGRSTPLRWSMLYGFACLDSPAFSFRACEHVNALASCASPPVTARPLAEVALLSTWSCSCFSTCSTARMSVSLPPPSAHSPLPLPLPLPYTQNIHIHHKHTHTHTPQTHAHTHYLSLPL
jgi:hypothetical protein